MKSHLMASAATAAILVTMMPVTMYAQSTPATGLGPINSTVSDAQSALPSGQPEDVIVTGTRQLGRTKQSSPAPVDVVSQAELQSTGQQNVFDALNKLLPSLELPATGFDTAGLVRSARLRGLSPDDTLVLIDGKRRHVSANINADVGPVGGSDPTDLDLIPISLVDHIEVLRDGAAAQYGSDAIAGVINIILKHATHGVSAYAQEGANYPSDGFTNDLGVSYALPIGDKGFFDVAGNYRYHDHTNRTGLDSRVALVPNAPTSLLGQLDANGKFIERENPGRIIGDPKYNLASVGYNTAYDFGAVTAYSFATYANRTASAFENWRTPTKLPAVYPNGFVPREGLYENDYAVTGGLKGQLPFGWNWDLSSTYGVDIDNIKTLNSGNPDLFAAIGFTPKRFHAGEFNNEEWTNNLDFSNTFDTGLFATPLSVAIGGEFRRDFYELKAGDFASTYGSGSQSFPGFSNLDASRTHRQNGAVYGDLATEILPHLQVDLAGRFEHYTDVGNTETGKVSARYDFSPAFAVRTTISNGFRAPTLAQDNFATVNVSPSSFTGQFPVNSAVAKVLGSTPLKPERSNNYSVGFTATPIPHMHVAVDLYQIDIRDQIVDSGTFGGNLNTPAGQQIKLLLQEQGVTLDPGLSQAQGQYYTNGVDSQTRGLDLTADYTMDLFNDATLAISLAVNFNDVELTRQAKLPNGQSQFTPDVISEYTTDAPKNKTVLQGTYTQGPLDIVLRETRWGTSTEVVQEAIVFNGTYITNRITPKYLTDIELGYRIVEGVKLSIGANNVFDVYPNKTNYNGRFVNSTVYADASPFGIDGGFYYARLNLNFGNTPPPPPPMPEPAAAAAAPAPLPARTYLVFFDWDRADLTVRARQIVASAAEASTHVQTTKIEVNGYTDLSGTAAYNQKLSVRRAKAVQAELEHDGVASNEIAIHGFGETKPLVPTAKGVREPQNRRVEIILM